jgi:hypothetical protein
MSFVTIAKERLEAQKRDFAQRIKRVDNAHIAEWSAKFRAQVTKHCTTPNPTLVKLEQLKTAYHQHLTERATGAEFLRDSLKPEEFELLREKMMTMHTERVEKYDKDTTNCSELKNAALKYAYDLFLTKTVEKFHSASEKMIVKITSAHQESTDDFIRRLARDDALLGLGFATIEGRDAEMEAVIRRTRDHLRDKKLEHELEKNEEAFRVFLAASIETDVAHFADLDISCRDGFGFDL